MAPPVFTREYAEMLRAREVDIAVTEVPGLGHDILLEPVATDHLGRLVAKVTAKRSRQP